MSIKYKEGAFYRLLNAYGLTVTELSGLINKSRSAITTRIKNDKIDIKMLEVIGTKKSKKPSEVLADYELLQSGKSIKFVE